VAAEIDLAAVRVPAVFAWIARAGGVEIPEMLRTFNCGVGMAVVAARDEADRLARQFEASGETVVRLGEIVPAEGPPETRFRGRLDLPA
jgi:phosphoribosylformylglycinamidine cyclo-ligase